MTAPRAGTAVDAAGRPYDRLALAGRTGRWQPLLELAVLLALAAVGIVLVFGLSVGLAAIAGVGTTETGLDDPVWDLGASFAMVAVLLPVVLLTVLSVGGRPVGTLWSVAGRVRWRRLLRCLVPALVLTALHVVPIVALDDAWDRAQWPGWQTCAAVALVAVLVVPVQAAAEEVATRGWLLQVLAPWTGARWVAVLVSSAVFVGLHGTTDPWVLADLTVFALAMCWLTVRTGGLEAATVLHAVVNIAYVLADSTQGVPDLDVVQTAGLSAGDALPSIAVTLAYTAWTARSARSAGA